MKNSIGDIVGNAISLLSEEHRSATRNIGKTFGRFNAQMARNANGVNDQFEISVLRRRPTAVAANIGRDERLSGSTGEKSFLALPTPGHGTGNILTYHQLCSTKASASMGRSTLYIM